MEKKLIHTWQYVPAATFDTARHASLLNVKFLVDKYDIVKTVNAPASITACVCFS